jgi:hypothetical protein
MADDFEAEQPEPEVSIGDDLRDAFAADGDAQAGIVPAAPAIPSEPAKAAEPGADGRVRAPDGKFAKAPEQGQSKAEPVSPQASGIEPPKEAIAPPAAWSAAAKADFASLPPHIQQEVMRREKDVTDGLAQRQQKDERFNRLDSLLAPRRERFQLAGLDEFQAVQALFAAQDLLDRDAPSGLRYLAKQYGVNLASLAQGAPAQAQQAPMPPVVQQLMNEVQSLKSAHNQQQQSADRAAQDQASQMVQAFSADPKNLYFENVRKDMADLVNSGQAKTIQEAYDRAVWANPETRPLMLRQQEEQRETERRAAATARSNAARHASGSITGSPTPGSSPARVNSPTATVADDLRDTIRELAG